MNISLSKPNVMRGTGKVTHQYCLNTAEVSFPKDVPLGGDEHVFDIVGIPISSSGNVLEVRIKRAEAEAARIMPEGSMDAPVLRNGHPAGYDHLIPFR
jgi:hypothetical protein